MIYRLNTQTKGIETPFPSPTSSPEKQVTRLSIRSYLLGNNNMTFILMSFLKIGIT